MKNLIEDTSWLPAHGSDLRIRVLDSLFAFVAVLELDGKVAYCNRAPLEAAGMVLDEVLGQSFWDCRWWRFDRAARARIKNACERAAQGETVRFEAVFQTGNGSRTSIDFQVSPLLSASGVITHLVPTGADISERKKVESNLRRSEELVRTIAENSTQGLAMMDHRGYCIYANNAWLEMTGYSFEEIRSAPLHDLVHHHYPDGRPYPLQECPIDRALPENYDIRAHEDVFFRKDGSSFPVLCAASPIFKDGKPVSTVIEIRDMTEVMKEQKARRESEAQFRALADNIPQLAWMMDPAGHTYWYNRRWYEYTGSNIEEMRGWGWKAAHHPDHVDRVAQKLLAHIASGMPWEDTFPLRRHDGEYGWFLSRAFPLRDESGAIICWFGSNTDVSEQLKAQQALREADRRKDEFIATLAHELRNPLAPVRSALEILRRVGAPDPHVARMRTIIERQVLHMARLLEDLFDVARITRGKLELQFDCCNLGHIAAETAEDFRTSMQAEGIHLEIVEGPEPLPVRGDSVRLGQVVANYLQNAKRFAPGGRVRVCAFSDNDTSEAVVRVSDDGVGIPPALLRKLFEPFAQADQDLARSKGGLGMGLAICKGIAELHGGSVRAESAGEQRGAAFELRLPLYLPTQSQV